MCLDSGARLRSAIAAAVMSCFHPCCQASYDEVEFDRIRKATVQVTRATGRAFLPLAKMGVEFTSYTWSAPCGSAWADSMLRK